jgi:ribosomal protein L7/L12
MQYGMDVRLREGFDAWDTSEEVAVRIIGNRDLRYAAENDGEYDVVIEDSGPDCVTLLETICALTGKSQQQARDIIESAAPDTKVAVNTDDMSHALAEEWAAKLRAAGATVAVV